MPSVDLFPGRRAPHHDRRRIPAILLITAMLVLPGMALASHGGDHSWEQTGKVWAPDGLGFGSSVAADGGTLVATALGAENTVHVFEEAAGGAWTLTQVLETPENELEDRGIWGSVNGQLFGFDLAIDADAGLLVVGAPGFDVTGEVLDHETDAGAVYIYEQASNGTWELAARFIGPVDGDWNDQDTPENDNRGPWMGLSVAVNQGTVVAGAPGHVVDDVPRRGLIDVYERSEDGTWMQAHRLITPSPNAEMWDMFGSDVAVGGDRFAVGAPSEDAGLGSGAGAVHIYERSLDGWQPVDRLTAALLYSEEDETHLPEDVMGDVATGASFGESLSFDADGSTLLVGSSLGNRLVGAALPTSADFDLGVDGVLTNPWGVAYVFSYEDGSWSHEASLENPDREAHSGFGLDLDINDAGDTLVVGAYLANQSEDAPVSINGEPILSTEPPVSDQGVVTHHPATGAAYVFEQGPNGWACSAQLSGDDTDSEGNEDDDFFGLAVAITESTVFAGAPANGGPHNPGTVYAFEPAGAVEDAATLDLPSNLGASCGVVS